MASEREVVIVEENNKAFGVKGKIDYDSQRKGYIVKESNKFLKYEWYDPKDKLTFERGEKHCDAIVEFSFDNIIKIVFIELKGNHVEDAIKQLQSTIRKLRSEYRERGIRWENLSKIAVVVANTGNVVTTGMYRQKRNLKIEGIQAKVKVRKAYLKVEDLVKCTFTFV